MTWIMLGIGWVALVVLAIRFIHVATYNPDDDR